MHTGYTLSSPSPTPITATSTPCYLTNPVATTTTTMPPLAPTLTCVTGHTQATPPPLLSLCVFYFILFYFILFYFILFYFILFYFILFYFILFYFILFYF